MKYVLIPLFLILMVPVQVFAQSQATIPDLDIGWRIQTFIEDFREKVAGSINPDWGEVIRNEATINAQARLEQLLQQGKPVPTDLFQRVQEKVEQSRPFVNSVGQEIRDDLTLVVETNEIRRIVSEFQTGNYNRDELQARINALDSIQKCDSVPQVSELEKDRQNAYKTIQEKYCPVLQNYGADRVLKILNRQ